MTIYTHVNRRIGLACPYTYTFAQIYIFLRLLVLLLVHKTVRIYTHISIIVITRHRSHRVGSRFLPFVVAQPLVDTVGIDGMQHRRTRSWERDEVPEPAGSSGSGRHCDWESDHGLSEDSSSISWWTFCWPGATFANLWGSCVHSGKQH